MALSDATEVPDALYNRYRPRTLSALVGQEHVTVPLRRAFEKGRIHHAYLLSGPRGCGKTSTARILAAGLVCENNGNGPTADPCNECVQCTSVIAGNHLDVIEMDAATNGRVDDAREIREKAHYSPAMARYKVVVIDEAHMVTKEGFNALLKLIEEPPPHLRFIFATTDPDKVLPTIRSRTYHYGFRLVAAPALAAHLTHVIASEGYTVEDGVTSLVVRAGRGSMRDSLAVLGQLIDGAEGTHVRADEAAALMGATADGVLDAILSGLAGRDTAATLTAIGAAIDGGAEPRRLGEDLLDILRDLLLLAATGALPPLAEIAGEERRGLWANVTERLGVRGLTAACEVLQAAVASSMFSGQPRVALEVATSRVLLALGDTVDVHAALNALSQQVAALGHGGAVTPAVHAVTPAPAHASVVTSPPVATPVVPAASTTAAVPEPVSAPVAVTPTQPEPSTTPQPPVAELTGDYGPADWERVLAAVAERKRSTWMVLNSQVKGARLIPGVIRLAAAAGFEQGFRNGGHADILTAAAGETLGGAWTVEVVIT